MILLLHISPVRCDFFSVIVYKNVKPGRYTENHKPKVNISRFLEKNRTKKEID